MKRITFYLLVLLLSVGLFSSAGQRNTGCKKLTGCTSSTKESNKPVVNKERGPGFGPLSFFLADF